MGHDDDLDTLSLLLDDNDSDNVNDVEEGKRCNHSRHSSHSSITLGVHRDRDFCELTVQPQQQQQQHGSPLPPFDIESEYESYKAGRLLRGQQAGDSYNIRERQQHHHHHHHRSAAAAGAAAVARPARTLLLARPVPFDPITDPFAYVCDIARRPKFGHQYVLCPDRRKRNGHEVGLSVGPHWSGVIYTMSIIAVVTIFLVRFLMNDAAPWCQPVTVACSLVTMGLLVATAVADPGIVVESAERGEGRAFCKECSIWRPDDAEHCEECGVCIFGLDHHCPWMGKCVGRGNILWFRLFNGSWILFLSLVVISMPYFNNNNNKNDSKEAVNEP